jgi:deazaflavin-dependent oxidoreductase (nitroreductase family)
MSDFNKEIIREFRTNEGEVGGIFEGMSLLLVHTTGAKSGQLRINPTVYFKDGEDLIIAASKGGADSHPDWYHNLVATNRVIIEVGKDTYSALAEVTSEPERSDLYGKLASKYPMFNEYKTKTKRVIPIIKLIKN